MAGKYGGSWWNPIDNILATPAKIADPNYNLVPGVSAGGGKGGAKPAPEPSRPKDATIPGAEQAARDYSNATVQSANTKTGNGSGGGAAGSGATPAEIAALERQLNMSNDSLGRIGGQTNSALANLMGKYTSEKARLDNARVDTETDYKQDRGRTTSDFARTKERIGENVRQNVSSLQRLLGSRGAGSSSASQIMAPYAAARAGTSEQEEAGQEFSDNLNALDTNWKRYDREWQNSNADLDANRINQERQTRSQFASKEAELQNAIQTYRDQLAIARGGGRTNSGAVDARISQLLNEIDALSRQDFGSVISAKDPRYAAPELSNYDIQTRGVQDQSQDPTYDETQAFYPVREDEEDKFLQSLYQ